MSERWNSKLQINKRSDSSIMHVFFLAWTLVAKSAIQLQQRSRCSLLLQNRHMKHCYLFIIYILNMASKETNTYVCVVARNIMRRERYKIHLGHINNRSHGSDACVWSLFPSSLFFLYMFFYFLLRFLFTYLPLSFTFLFFFLLFSSIVLRFLLLFPYLFLDRSFAFIFASPTLPPLLIASIFLYRESSFYFLFPQGI